MKMDGMVMSIMIEFANPTIFLGKNKLFPGSSQYSRFTNGLGHALKANEIEIKKGGY